MDAPSFSFPLPFPPSFTIHKAVCVCTRHLAAACTPPVVRRRKAVSRFGFSVLVIAFVFASSTALADESASWKPVDEALGLPGTTVAGDVHRFSFPRSDLAVTVDGVSLEPALALTSWLAFHRVEGKTMVMGDLVLTEDEVKPVQRRLLANGIEVTALHNHLLRTRSAVYYMHVYGMGDGGKLARALREALGLTRTPLSPPARVPPPDIDGSVLDKIMGQEGRASSGVYTYSIPRPEEIRENGIVVPPAMGTTTAINFQPIGDGRSAVTGDFVLRAGEVHAVMQALAASGIEVTALHNHLIAEEPRLFFLHFWAVGETLTLARGLRHALDRLASG